MARYDSTGREDGKAIADVGSFEEGCEDKGEAWTFAYANEFGELRAPPSLISLLSTYCVHPDPTLTCSSHIEAIFLEVGMACCLFATSSSSRASATSSHLRKASRTGIWT